MDNHALMIEPDERMRRGALALLDDGNSVEAVARVLDVPADTVLAWRAGQATPPAASAADDALPPSAASVPGDGAGVPRFDGTLHYAASTGFRATGLIGAIAIAAWSVSEALSMAGGDRAGLIEDALAAITLIAGTWAAIIVLRWSLRGLVLEPDRIVVPGLVRRSTLAYADLAGYAFLPGGIKLDRNVSIKGRTLLICSRRARAKPLKVFVHDAYPMDPRILERLDKVLKAQRVAEYQALFANLRSRGMRL